MKVLKSFAIVMMVAVPAYVAFGAKSEVRMLPSGSAGPGCFSAYYTHLEYSSDWEQPWRIGSHADVVVRFDEGFAPRLVFWHGTNYIPFWVAENGIGYTNEFIERGRNARSGLVSGGEPMNDKQCRFSHVRIIENNDARVVIHWRYSPVDVEYQQPFVDGNTGWGDWVDEYYMVYPDGVCVRKITLYSSALKDWTEWQESIVINPPGTKPEDNIQSSAVTLANLEGLSGMYMWTENRKPEPIALPENPCIHIVNLKARYKPFVIVPPRGARINLFKARTQGSRFFIYDKWPFEEGEIDGERPFLTSLSHVIWRPYEKTNKYITKISLNGMTDRKASDLVPLAKSWLNPAEIKLKYGTFTSEGYVPAQRAYILSCSNTGKPVKLEFELAASQDSPVVNPAFVVKNWGRADVVLKVDGKTIKRGKNFRVGYEKTDAGTDLIVWVKKETTKPIVISLSPVAD